MKTVGIITEYNPFHKGHAYQIQQARQITGASNVVVVMSGDFVQRGAPAIVNKYYRTAMALSQGVDLVLELPVRYATGSAEYFANGAVSLLHSLGCIDYLCFGTESGSLEQMNEVAQLLLDEPNDYRTALKAHLARGLNFPTARMEALLSCQNSARFSLASPDSPWSFPSLVQLLRSPNNILGIEYCKQLKRLQSPMAPVPILRKGSDYHSEELSSQFSSATAIRKAIQTGNWEDVASATSPNVLAILKEVESSTQGNGCTVLDDYSLLLKYRLMRETPESLLQYQDVTPQLANRISTHLNEFTTYTQFIQLLKTRDITHGRIARALLHILLSIPAFQSNTGNKSCPSNFPYARVLGFRRDATHLLSSIKEEGSLPLVTKLTHRDRQLSSQGLSLLEEDIWAANLYETVFASRTQTPFKNECTWQLRII